VADSPDASTDRDPGGPDLGGPPPPGVDASVPHPARVRNFWLGGHDYFKADRVAGTQLAQAYPHLPEMARAERAFLVRATRFLAGPARIRQFLDIGSGLPTGGNTHEIAQRIVPDTGIVYVDNDPVVLAHAKALLDQAGAAAGGPVSYVDADLRDVAVVLTGAASTLDFGRPVALIMLGVLGYIADYGAARSITSQLISALPSGSYLAIADGVSTDDGINRAQLRFNSRADATYDSHHSHADAYNLRRPDEFASFFEGLNLVDPGVVPCAKWKPDRASADGQAVPVHCGIART
jgi:O-methyltransferase involved in polyketide biosynthesis